MPRVIIHKITGRVDEFQSLAVKGTLLKNISDNGGNPADYEERVVTEAEYQGLFKNDPTRISEREINEEEILISARSDKIARDRDRKKAVTELKLEGNNFKYFDANGKQK